MFRNHLTTIVEGRTNASRPNSETQESLQNENASSPPPIPPKSTYRSHPSRILSRPRQKRLNYGTPTLEPNEKAPPSYRSIFGGGGSSTKGSSRASNSDFAPEPTFIERQKLRGGWRRLLLLLLVLLLLIIGLAIGLGVGLTQKHKSASSNTSGSSQSLSTGDDNEPFPIGTWSIPTYLTNTSTLCTTNSLAWDCAPYNDYTSATPQASFSTFDWVINSTSSPPSNSSLVVSSTSNPFYVTFNATKLTLMDQGTPSERFAFELPLPRSVFPRGSLTADGAATVCYFNDTVLSGSLYTQKPADLLDSGASSSSDSTEAGQQKQWKAAAMITQTSGGGNGIPDCYPATGGVVSGPRITQGLTPTSASQECICVYENAGELS